jgi:hypothetical protein
MDLEAIGEACFARVRKPTTSTITWTSTWTLTWSCTCSWSAVAVVRESGHEIKGGPGRSAQRQRLSRKGQRTLAGGETTGEGRYLPMRPGGAQDPRRGSTSATARIQSSFPRPSRALRPRLSPPGDFITGST